MDESNPHAGKLKFFLGYADGVGKTQAMLQAAHQRLVEGTEVLIACLDPASYPIADRFEILISNLITDDGKSFPTEIDLDQILQRKPQLVVVDDLAHTNPPDAKHPKRYQDVTDLLAAGIDVYTTLNIFQLESLRDVINQITGITISETIPDRFFDQAAIIELVDLAPDEVLKRFRDGKIHPAGEWGDHAHLLYQPGNLIALRELCMRRAAGQVEMQMQAYMADRKIAGPWAASERLAVCISSHPLGERLVRTGQRLATALNATWFVVYVETPGRLRLSSHSQESVLRTLRLAEELGARVMKISGHTITETILEFAHRENITKIILGKPIRPRWEEFFSGSIVDEIIRRSGSIDTYVVSEPAGPVRQGFRELWKFHGRWQRYLFAILLVITTTLIGLPLLNLFHPTNLVMLYLVAVVISAFYLGRGPSILASILSVIAFDYFFTHPQLSLTVSDTQYLLTFFVLLAVGLVISSLSGLVRDQVEASQQREAQAATLYTLSRELTIAVDLPSILNTIVHQIAHTFNSESVIYLNEKGVLSINTASPGIKLDDTEESAICWAFDYGEATGRGTNTLPQAHIRCMPLLTPRGRIGVLAVKLPDPAHSLSTEERRFLDAYTSLAAIAIERAHLAEESSQAQIISATEKLQTALLNSISHDLRTPLASITGVFSSLYEAEKSSTSTVELNQADRLDLIETGWEEARRLNRLVGNLLELSRLESGALKLNLQSSDVQDVIGTAIARLSDRLSTHPLEINIPLHIPLVKIDFVLVEQVLVNVLENAAKYSPAGSTIEVSAQQIDNEVEISIADMGIGIPETDLEKVFEKFFRIQRKETVSGTGLGLSICKGLIEAHGGHIQAENRSPVGTIIRFTLPVENTAS